MNRSPTIVRKLIRAVCPLFASLALWRLQTSRRQTSLHASYRYLQKRATRSGCLITTCCPSAGILYGILEPHGHPRERLTRHCYIYSAKFKNED